MLVRLLYASRAVDPSPEAIETILAKSRQYNPTCGITGILCYGGGVFLQAIEGGRMAVSELYGHIQKDKRHKDVVLLHYEPGKPPVLAARIEALEEQGGSGFMDYQLPEAVLAAGPWGRSTCPRLITASCSSTLKNPSWTRMRSRAACRWPCSKN